METATVTMFERERTEAAEAVKALGRALVEGLSDRLAEVNRPLQEEADAQSSKAAKLRKSYGEWKERAEAKSRVLSGEIDAAVAQGDDALAEKKRQDGKELDAGLAEIWRQVTTCEARVQELVERQKDNARSIFREIYPELPRATHAVVESVVDLLDALEQGLRDYVREADIEGTFPYLFLKQRHIVDLIPHTGNGKGELMRRVDLRFGDRR